MLFRRLCGSVFLDELVRGVVAPLDTIHIFGACSFVLVENLQNLHVLVSLGNSRKLKGYMKAYDFLLK